MFDSISKVPEDSNANDEQRVVILDPGRNEVQFLEFTVQQQNFGVNVAKVAQAIVWEESKLIRLPGCDDIILGSVLFRGLPILVINLAGALGISDPPDVGVKRLLLVLDFNKKSTGFIIDTIQGIQRFSWSDFVPMPVSEHSNANEVFVGSVNLRDRIMLILDFEVIMAEIDPSMCVKHRADNASVELKAHRGELKIVYAEDSKILRQIVLGVLNKSGFDQVSVFTTGAEALAYVRDPKNHTDVIISDIEMPEMDGMSFCKAIKDLPEYSRLPFIFFSSMISEPLKRKCKVVGATAALSKPEVDSIVMIIDQLCAKNPPTTDGFFWNEDEETPLLNVF